MEHSKRKRDRGTQTPIPVEKSSMDVSVQCGSDFKAGSYGRNKESHWFTHRFLLQTVLNSKESSIEWCMDHNIIKSFVNCPTCKCQMILSKTKSCSDGLIWRCQKNNHGVEQSIRNDSWCSKSNLRIEEIIELTYWWSTGKCLMK